MPERGDEVFSNPLPPSLQPEEDEDDPNLQPLTNEDFRKLMMTPRVPSSGAGATTVKAAPARETKPSSAEDDPAEKRKKKKSYYAKLKKAEEERQKELESKYRDRAAERRDGQNIDYEQTDLISTTADYRAVAPDAKAGEHYAERRKQLIQESKYLGGDMEHTHLVKGLDYALLEKVRAEISTKEIEEEEMMELAVENADKPEPEKEKEEDPEEALNFRTKLARNVYRSQFKHKWPERNELFLPGRMAYVVDMEDDFGESDIPTTLIRSKADCVSLEATTTLTTNDIVINKLTQILSYLRQGRRDNKKLKKKEKVGKIKEEEKKLVPVDIYEDIGDYLPTGAGKDKENKARERERGGERGDRDRDRERSGRDRRDRDREDRRGDRDDRGHRDRDSRRDRDRDRDRRDRDRGGRDHDRERERGGDRSRRGGGGEREREPERTEHRSAEKKKSYFEKPTDDEEVRPAVDAGPGNARELVKSINDRFKSFAPADMDPVGIPELEQKKEKEDKKMKKKLEVDSYAECYPGMMESADAIDDSDDEVDYTKMDQGNKKGPVGRWDFDTQEEYSDYMSNKEALPKAAFQYGVKMADGRKTRRTGPKDEKRQLDQEWQKIQNIIAKRKQMGDSGGPNSKSARR